MFSLNEEFITGDMGRRRVSRNNNPNKINAPSFIYKILYGDDVDIRGYDYTDNKVHVKYNYDNETQVDSEIPRQALDDLNSIKEIELRSSCQGYNEKRPTYLIFRPLNQKEEYVKKLVNNLKQQRNLKAGFDIGNNGHFRIGVTTNLYYSDDNKDKFQQWWLDLPKKIKKSL